MKYWIFHDNQVLGPYEPQELERHASFGADSLVCPEGRRGTNMGDWQKAATVPELTHAFLPPAPVATAPPPALEPAVRETAAFDEIRVKLSHVEKEIQEKLSHFETELSHVRETLDAKAAAADVAKELEALRAQLTERPAPPSILEPPAAPAPLPPAEPPPSASAAEPPPFSKPESILTTVEPTPETPKPKPLTLETTVETLDLASTTTETPTDPPPPTTTPAAAKPPKKKRTNLIIGVVVGAFALIVLIAMAGRSPKAPPVEPAAVPEGPASPEPLATTPAAPPRTADEAPPQTRDEIAPPSDPRAEAIDLAKQWTLSDGRTLGAALEAVSPPNGNLSPWMAEPLPNEHASVNYFARGGGPGTPTVAYEFDVDLAAKSVIGRNSAAKAVLSGRAASPPAPPKAKPVRIKAKKKTRRAKPRKAADETALDNVLSGN